MTGFGRRRKKKKGMARGRTLNAASKKMHRTVVSSGVGPGGMGEESKGLGIDDASLERVEEGGVGMAGTSSKEKRVYGEL
jgi:hypothetical protein